VNEDVGNTLAALNACLNGASAVCIFAAWRAVKGGSVRWHRRLMLTAVTLSALFLISYLTRFALTGTHRYPVDDWTRVLYLVILGTHTALAAAVPVLVVRAIYLALKDRVDAHRRLVRYAFPIWGYVSVTGVVIYLMLYHLAPARL
jgi:uncharacterized membrane protein YozB (DUF420 family)